jgi:hypothetical protein
MKQIFEQILGLALFYLKKGVMKDFVLHTQGVVKAMELILQIEKGNENILIPAAILHDVGWSKIPINLQKSQDETDKKQAIKLHLEYASSIIREILTKINYPQKQIQKIINLVKAHKFEDPKNLDKQLLIDADSLADAFKEQFYSDVESYSTTPEKLYEFRKQNQFYTSIARKIFKEELEKRKREFQASKIN